MSKTADHEKSDEHAFLSDISALRQDEFAYRFAVEAARIGTWNRDLATDLVMISPMLAQILGLSPDQTVLSAQRWQSLVMPEDVPLLEQEIASSFHSGKVGVAEFRVMRGDGRVVWFLSRGMVFKDANGAPVRAAGVMIDITEKKNAEAAMRASEERYRQLTDLSPDGILVSLNSKFVYANASAVRIFGARDLHDVVGHSPFKFIDPAVHALIQARQVLVVEHKQTAPTVEWRCMRLDGRAIHVQSTAGSVTWEGQPAVQILLRDVTELKETRDKLRVLNERLKLAVEGRGEGIWDWDMTDNSYTITGGLKKIFGWEEEDDISKMFDWRQLVHRDDYPRVLSAIQAHVEGKTPVFQCEFRLKSRDKSWKWVLSRGIIVARDENQRPVAMTGTMTDITSQKASDDLVWRHAHLDPLTDLPNRRLFRERLETEVRKARRTGHQLALLFIDLDGFKQVNDLYGHDTGDLLLMEAGHRIRACVRETDTVARLGGDEFTVMLTDLGTLDHVEFVCQKVLNSLSQPFLIGKDFAYLSGSIGVAHYPFDATTSEELVRLADQAMYTAKNNGKNQFSYFTQSMDEKAHKRLRITNELRRALPAGQLAVHYQPVVDLATGAIVKGEALLRWEHPTLGVVEPSVFIPLAEEAGLIGQIGNWVFREAAVCSKRWSEQLGKPFQISVNKSPVQFVSREAESNWLGYLAELGLSGNCISIEITEGLLLHASSTVADKLLEYRDAGIQVAIDDFGTGYSSMAYLQKFHIDYLKIDQSFVRDIATNAGNRTIAETIILMAHKLGLKVIAEGIETKAQLECLVEAGCDYGQGYLFSRPIPVSRFEQLLTHGLQQG